MNVKQVIVIRKDLKMRRGKEIAQGAHASMAWLSRRICRDGFEDFWGDGKSFSAQTAEFSPVEKEWLTGAFAKVTLQVESEEALRAIYEQAKAGLEAHLIIDSGRTEFDGVPTATAVGIGPDEAEKLDKITGELKLY